MKKTTQNRIPTTVNPTPDYYCTWLTQWFAAPTHNPDGQRKIMTEHALFDREKPLGWAYFYEKARNDLFFVMDDGWDIPFCYDRDDFSALQLPEEKFPSFTKGKNKEEAFFALSDKMKSLGWKGLGYWVAAEACGKAPDKDAPDYWQKRLVSAEKSGCSYWKVDWGHHEREGAFRKNLTSLAKTYAPSVTVEHAMVESIVPYSDSFRTYDVPEIMSIPMTMEKIAHYIPDEDVKTDALGLINCEDEVYMAAAGGFAMGVMRYPYIGDLDNGKGDCSFPSVHRNVKTKMTEVLRAVRFHRLAPAFAMKKEQMQVSAETLTDTWRIENLEDEIKKWWMNMPAIGEHTVDGLITKEAPAMIGRNTAFPKVTSDANGDKPYIMATDFANGVYAVATFGRTRERDYFIPLCDVTVDVGDAETVGIFGAYKTLTLHVAGPVHHVYMQDLASDFAYDVTEDVTFSCDNIQLDGNLLCKIGTSENPTGDTSEAGLLVWWE